METYEMLDAEITESPAPSGSSQGTLEMYEQFPSQFSTDDSVRSDGNTLSFQTGFGIYSDDPNDFLNQLGAGVWNDPGLQTGEGMDSAMAFSQLLDQVQNGGTTDNGGDGTTTTVGDSPPPGDAAPTGLTAGDGSPLTEISEGWLDAQREGFFDSGITISSGFGGPGTGTFAGDQGIFAGEPTGNYGDPGSQLAQGSDGLSLSAGDPIGELAGDPVGDPGADPSGAGGQPGSDDSSQSGASDSSQSGDSDSFGGDD